jgi:cytochrome c biogenesis protein CcmG, thiol:disulfide interchange protein DsbE
VLKSKRTGQSSRAKWLAGAVAGTVVLVVGLLWLLSPVRTKFVPYAAPQLKLTSLASNKPIDLAALRGKPVVVNFFFSDCPPCRKELPLFESTSRRTDVSVVGVNSEPAKLGRPFVAQLGLTFPVATDPASSVALRFGVQTFPATFFIDANGVVRSRRYGAISKSELEREINALSRVIS